MYDNYDKYDKYVKNRIVIKIYFSLQRQTDCNKEIGLKYQTITEEFSRCQLQSESAYFNLEK